MKDSFALADSSAIGKAAPIEPFSNGSVDEVLLRRKGKVTSFFCFILLVLPGVAFAGAPLSLKSVMGLETPDGTQVLHVWEHPSGDRLVALTNDAVYAVDPLEQSYTKWLDVGGRSMASEGERLFVCGAEGLSELKATTWAAVWTGDCRGVSLGSSIWIQADDELVRLGWSEFREEERISLETGEKWAVVGDQLVRWRTEPPTLRTRADLGEIEVRPALAPHSLVENTDSALWLLEDGVTIMSQSLESVRLQHKVDGLVGLPGLPGWMLGAHVDNRAVRLLDDSGKGEVVFPTLSPPERVSVSDLDNDGCADFIAWGQEATWVQLRCQSLDSTLTHNGSASGGSRSGNEDAGSPSGASDEPVERVSLSAEWVAKSFVVNKPMRLALDAVGEISIDAASLPPGVSFSDGYLSGTPSQSGQYPITAAITAPGGQVSAGGLSVAVVGEGAGENAPALVQSPVREPATQCLMATGLLIGTGSSQVDWTNLTGRRTVFGSPTFSLLCSDRRGSKMRLLYGGETAPTAIVSDTETKSLLATGVVHFGGSDEGVGLYGSVGLVSLSAGVRVVKAFGDPTLGRMRGLELRLGWMPLSVGAVEFSGAYTWKMGRRYGKRR